MTTQIKKTSRTEQVGGALSLVDGPKARAMQHALAEAVIARDRAAANVPETHASLQDLKRAPSQQAVAAAALTFAEVIGGKRACELEAAVSTEVTAGFSPLDAVCSALKLFPAEMAEDLIRVVRKAKKAMEDHQEAVAKATAAVRSAADDLKAADLGLQKLLKEAELLVHTSAPSGSQARAMLKRSYPRKKATALAPVQPQNNEGVAPPLKTVA
jgi:hypothetical protein